MQPRQIDNGLRGQPCILHSAYSSNAFSVTSCDSIEKLKAKLPLLDAELRDPAKFKDLYQFTFNYAKNPGQKGLDLEMAIAYWRIVLGNRFPYLELWCNFLLVSSG